jgi:hypothetical protein
MFKRPIQPLPEGMADAISASINKLEYVKENTPAKRGSDAAKMDDNQFKKDLAAVKAGKADASKMADKWGTRGGAFLNMVRESKHNRDADKEAGEKKAIKGETPDTSKLDKATDITKEDLDEAKKMKGDDPCWDSHEMVGHKMKDGKKVPNCVKKEETDLEEGSYKDGDTRMGSIAVSSDEERKRRAAMARARKLKQNRHKIGEQIENLEEKQGSKEHLDRLLKMLAKEKPGSSDASQIKHAIEKMHGADKIPAKYKNAKPDMYESCDSLREGYYAVAAVRGGMEIDGPYETEEDAIDSSGMVDDILHKSEFKNKNFLKTIPEDESITVSLSKYKSVVKPGVYERLSEEVKVSYAKSDMYGESKMDESRKVIAKGGGYEVISHSPDREGSAIDIMKNGKKVASGDYDSGAGTFFVKAGKKTSFDNAQDIIKALAEAYAKPKPGKTDDGKGLDPVGHGDEDIDNDGDSDSSDKYLHARRKAIGKAMKKRDE